VNNLTPELVEFIARLADDSARRSRQSDRESDAITTMARSARCISELDEALRSLNEAQLAELEALMWMGQTGSRRPEWDELLDRAQDDVGDNDAEGVVSYLEGKRSLGEYLRKGLAAMRPGPHHWR
jgi:hypothetical protein